MSQQVSRRPRLRRHRFNKPSFVMQERDLAIVQLVAAYRVISSEEVMALTPGSNQVILRRLQALYHAGYLDRPRHQRALGNAKMVYALGARGSATLGLAGSNRRDWTEKNRGMGAGYLDHQLMISRFRAVLLLAGRDAHVEIAEWRQGTEVWDHVEVQHDGTTERLPVAPDAAFVLRLANEPNGKNRIRCFLEADRGTMTVRRFRRKQLAYFAYWRSGRLQERYGVRNALVITVTRTPVRAENLAATTRTVAAPDGRGLRMFLFGTEAAYTLASPDAILRRVWHCPADSALHTLTE